MMVSKVQYCALLAVLVFDVNCQQNSESSVSKADLAQVKFINVDFKNISLRGLGPPQDLLSNFLLRNVKVGL